MPPFSCVWYMFHRSRHDGFIVKSFLFSFVFVAGRRICLFSVSLAPSDAWSLFRLSLPVTTVPLDQGMPVLSCASLRFRRWVPCLPFFSVSLAPHSADTWSLFRLPLRLATCFIGPRHDGLIAMLSLFFPLLFSFLSLGVVFVSPVSLTPYAQTSSLYRLSLRLLMTLQYCTTAVCSTAVSENAHTNGVFKHHFSAKEILL